MIVLICVCLISAYIDAIDKTKAGFIQEAQHLIKQGNRDKAQIMLNKKKYVEREVGLLILHVRVQLNLISVLQCCKIKYCAPRKDFSI